VIDSEAAARIWLEGLPEWDALAAKRLTALIVMLTAENGRQNLVSAGSLGQVWQRHIADSAQLLLHVPRETCTPWLDLGTGAGFPGLVIAALRPECSVWMIESRKGRAAWLEQARIALGLDQAIVIGATLAHIPTEKVSAISARAFAPLPRLLELSARFSTSVTRFVLPKGRSARQELTNLAGWRHKFHVEHSLTDPEAGIVVGQLLGRTGETP
jgi:16S rRNA (guanine527-N7)-methyltransferase